MKCKKHKAYSSRFHELSISLGDNSNATGKDALHWKSIYFEVNMSIYMID